MNTTSFNKHITSLGIIIVNSEEDIHNLIKRFGKGMVLSMCVEDILIYITSYNEYITSYNEYHFSNYLFAFIENEMKDGQLPENKAILNKLYDRFYKAYVARYKKKFEGIDLEIDPITCDTMQHHAYIKTDWDNNCKIVYSLATILKFCAIKKEPDIDEDGNEIYYDKDLRLNQYISPHTKSIFCISDVICVKLHLLKN
jgi:hypothetical protein